MLVRAHLTNIVSLIIFPNIEAGDRLFVVVGTGFKKKLTTDSFLFPQESHSVRDPQHLFPYQWETRSRLPFPWHSYHSIRVDLL